MKNEIEVKTIEKYTYMLFSSRNDDTDAKAIIMITSGTEFLGYLYFMPDGSVLPETEKKHNLFCFYYHYRDLPVVVDMMRNESPVYILYMESNKRNCRISTTMEEVGEGEGVGEGK